MWQDSLVVLCFQLLLSAKTFYCQRNGFQSLIICDSELYFSKVSPQALIIQQFSSAVR